MSIAREIISAFPQYDEILTMARSVKQFPMTEETKENEVKSLQRLNSFGNSFILRILIANNLVITDIITPINQDMFPLICVKYADLYVSLDENQMLNVNQTILKETRFAYLADFNKVLFDISGIRMDNSEKELNILFVCENDANEMTLRITALKLAYAILKDN